MPEATQVAMNTLISIRVVRDEQGAAEAMERAFGWFDEIESRCSRFDGGSELMQLCGRVGEAVQTSALLFEAVHFALLMAEETGGVFDPTVGRPMQALGFNREHRSGAVLVSEPSPGATYRDVELNVERRTVTLHRPLTLDLGAVAKGLAIDLAARELQPFRDFGIDAGGDVYLGGCNVKNEPWSVGIRHPRRAGELIAQVQASDRAVCTSGDYERTTPEGGHHILDPRTGASACGLASATVIAPGAMLADALATAAFVLGPEAGLALLERCGAEGLLITPDLERYQTGGLGLAA